MKKLILFLFTVGLLYNCENSDNEISEEFETLLISKGALSGGEKIPKQNTIIDNEADWNALIQKMDVINTISDSFSETDIDFAKFNILVIFDDIKPNGGYEFEYNVTKNDDAIHINTNYLEPSGNATTVITQPYIVLKISKTDLPITFSLFETDQILQLPPEPIDFIGETLSVGNFKVRTFLNVDQLIALEVNSINTEALNLTSDTQPFSLPNENIEVNISEWDIPLGEYHNDFDYLINLGGPIPQQIENWSVSSGTISISYQEPVDDPNSSVDIGNPTIDIIISGTLFENESTERVYKIEYLLLEDIEIGLGL